MQLETLTLKFHFFKKSYTVQCCCFYRDGTAQIISPNGVKELYSSHFKFIAGSLQTQANKCAPVTLTITFTAAGQMQQ